MKTPYLLHALILASVTTGCGLLTDDAMGLRSPSDSASDSTADTSHVDALDDVADTEVFDASDAAETKPSVVANLALYRKSDGMVGLGRLEADGAVLTLGTVKATTGWSSVVALSETILVGFDETTGTRQLAKLGGTSDAPTITLGKSEILGTKWTALTRFGADSMISYARGDGSLRVDTVSGLELTVSRSFTPVTGASGEVWRGYDLLTSTRSKALFLYGKNRGNYFRFDSPSPDSRYSNDGFSPDWSLIAPVGEDRWFWYMAASPYIGIAALTRADSAKISDIMTWELGKNPLPLPPLQYSSIVSTKTATLFRFAEAVYAGTFAADDGKFQLLTPERRSTIDPSWTHVVSLE